MTVFCLLWTPLCYLFWRSLTQDSPDNSGGVWALLLGSIVALIQFFVGSFINPGGFGFMRWLSGAVDIVVLPVLLPIIVFYLFMLFRIISSSGDATNFTFLWLIPSAAVRSVGWSAQNEPMLLVMVPLIWSSLGVGMCLFIRLVLEDRGAIRIAALAALVVLPFAAATAFWAFFSQRHIIGWPCLALTLAPMAAYMFVLFLRAQKNA